MTGADPVDLVVSLLILVSALFSFAGSAGLARLPDFYMRLHGPAKTTTLGVGGMLSASLVYFSVHGRVALGELLIGGLLFIAAPVAAHMLARAAIRRRVPSLTPVPTELERTVEKHVAD